MGAAPGKQEAVDGRSSPSTTRGFASSCFPSKDVLDQEESLETIVHQGAELQRVADEICRDELCSLQFSLTLADPSVEDCPLVACSLGFSELTGYHLQEIIGRNCRFLLNGVPEYLIDQNVRMKARAYCATVARGSRYCEAEKDLPKEIVNDRPNISQGETLCVQINARKTGELFRNMFFMREVELDESTYIIGLQAGIHEDVMLDSGFEDLCKVAFDKLEQNMNMLEQVLAAQFWYSGSMRRQQ